MSFTEYYETILRSLVSVVRRIFLYTWFQ